MHAEGCGSEKLWLVGPGGLTCLWQNANDVIRTEKADSKTAAMFKLWHGCYIQAFICDTIAIQPVVKWQAVYSVESVLGLLAKGASESTASEDDGTAAGANGVPDPWSVAACSAVPEPPAVSLVTVDGAASTVCGAVSVVSARCSARARDCCVIVDDRSMVLAAMSLILISQNIVALLKISSLSS